MILLRSVQKRAPIWRPFFWVYIPALLFVVGQDSAASTICLKDVDAAAVVIKRVTDGDTVVLEDDRRVRIIGINTAELNAPQPWSRSLARQGSNAVDRWRRNSQRIFLIEGKEALDRHGRVLAHLINEHGELLSQYLIAQGIAAATAVRPNTVCANHLSEIEQRARSAGSGVWHKRNPWFVSDELILKKTHSGFRIVRGNIERIRKTKHTHVLTLDNKLTISVRNKLYDTIKDRIRVNQAIEVRGWVSFRGKQPRVTLHHETNLRFL